MFIYRLLRTAELHGWTRRISGRDLGLVSRLLLLLRRQLRLLLLQLRLLLGQFLLLLLSLLLNRSHPSLNVGSGLEILAIELDGARYQLILGIVVPLYVDLKAGLKSWSRSSASCERGTGPRPSSASVSGVRRTTTFPIS